MLILRIILKTALLPVMLILMTLKAIVSICLELSSFVLGALMLFATGSLIYMIITKDWNQVLILFLMDVALVAVGTCAGIIETLIDAAIQAVACI